MGLTSYPNITIDSTNAFITLTDFHNGSIITSTCAATSIIVTPSLLAGFSCTVIQYGAGTITVTASGTGATVSGVGGATRTNAQYSVMTVVAVSNGNVVLGGSIA